MTLTPPNHFDPTPKRNPWGALVGYAAGSFGVNTILWPISSLLLYFLTETVGFSVAVATVVITAPKVWDIFVDPAIGAWADRSSARANSRSRMLLLAAGGVPAAVTCVFLLPAGSPPWTAAIVVLLLIASSSAFMVFFISHVALADDMEYAGALRRDTVLAVRVAGQATGSLCAGAVGPLVISALGSGSGAYRAMACLLATAGVAGMAVVAMAARGFPTRPSLKQAAGASLLVALGAVARNRTAGALIVSNFMLYIAASVVSTFMPYLNKLLLHEPDASLSILYSCIMVAMVAGSALAAFATRGLPRPVVLVFGAALMSLATALFHVTSVGGGRTGASGGFLIWGLGLGIYALVIFSSMMDAAAQPVSSADLNAGVAAPAAGAGLLLGLLISTGKVGDSLGGLIAGAMLSWSGYRAGAPVDDSTLQSLRLAYSTVPLTAMLVSTAALLPLLRRRRSPTDAYVRA